MGFFNLFKGRSNNSDIEAVLIGYFRTESCKLLGIEPNTQEYDEAFQSASEHIETKLVPCLDKQIQQEIVNTLNSVATDRFNEMFGAYIFLLFVRFSVISGHILSGKVKAEEATPDIIASVIHSQIKKLIAQD